MLDQAQKSEEGLALPSDIVLPLAQAKNEVSAEVGETLNYKAREVALL